MHCHAYVHQPTEAQPTITNRLPTDRNRPTQAWARPGTLVWDPYCGTGSILLAAARFGAHVMGGDIDMRVLKLVRW